MNGNIIYTFKINGCYVSHRIKSIKKNMSVLLDSHNKHKIRFENVNVLNEAVCFAA